MGLKERLSEQGKKLLGARLMMRMTSSDRVMKVANGVMDYKNRVRAAGDKAAEAWTILINGYGLPPIDPALDDDSDVIAAGHAQTTTPDISKEKRVSRPASSESADAAKSPLNKAKEKAPEAQESDSAGASSKAEKKAEAPDAAHEKLAHQMAARTSLSRIGGRDVFEKCFKFMTADHASQSPRRSAGRHRKIRNEHDRLALGERLDAPS